eukprot:NODE_10346_length_309_cov_142.015748.p2 GENE.NODE_10346_length_309_cov_142.015748~~NODE_10346_length_309_cov_142.015748.p2  ORF type:complete len:79 (+),score=14.90 NODE_10346_length_309_cov_142.015748:3-239(+)
MGGNQERELGLPVSPLCDRNTYDVHNAQRSILQYIVLPTFEALARIDSDLAVPLSYIKNSCSRFDATDPEDEGGPLDA